MPLVCIPSASATSCCSWCRQPVSSELDYELVRNAMLAFGASHRHSSTAHRKPDSESNRVIFSSSLSLGSTAKLLSYIS